MMRAINTEEKSRIKHQQWLNALALAPDQHPRNVVRSFACLGECGVRPVPARVVGVMPGGTSLAAIALPTGRAMNNDLVRSCLPVLVNIEIHRFRPRGCGAGDQAGFI